MALPYPVLPMAPAGTYATAELSPNQMGLTYPKFGLAPWPVIPTKMVYTLDEFGITDCDIIRTYADSVRLNLHENVAQGYGIGAVPGQSFHTSKVAAIAVFPIPPEDIGKTFNVYLTYVNVMTSGFTPFINDTSGRFVVTVTPEGYVIDDQYNRTINITEHGILGVSDNMTYEIAVQIENTVDLFHFPGIVLTDTLFEYIIDWTPAWVDFYFPHCNLPPKVIEPPKFERLPKFSNFAMPINPFGF